MHSFVFPVFILEGVSLSLTLLISVLMFSCHFLTWKMWVVLGTQAPAICLVQLPQMAKPAPGHGVCSSAVLPMALLPGLLPHWKGKVELTGVCRLEKCIGFLLLSMLWRKRGESVGVFFSSQVWGLKKHLKIYSFFEVLQSDFQACDLRMLALWGCQSAINPILGYKPTHITTLTREGVVKWQRS